MGKNLNIKLRVLRISRNWSQEYVAEQIELTQPAYAKLEAGHVKLTIERAKQIASLYNIEAESFFDESSIEILDRYRFTQKDSENKLDESYEVAHILKKLRLHHNYTQEYVASVLDINQNSYCKLELGQTHLTLDRIKKLADLYNIAASEIIFPTNVRVNSIDEISQLENIIMAQKDEIAHLRNLNMELLKRIGITTIINESQMSWPLKH